MKLKTALIPLAAMAAFIACGDSTENPGSGSDSGVQTKSDGSTATTDSSVGGDDDDSKDSGSVSDTGTSVDSSTSGDSSTVTDSGVTDSGVLDSGIVTCATAGCSVNATCNEDGGPASCTCNNGYTGDGKTCMNVDDCAGNPCQNGGTCVDGIASYTCNCAAGYEGATCGSNIDDCTPNPCKNGGTCADGVAAYTCTCVNGYGGTNCDTSYPTSCSAIKTANAAAADGVYPIDPDGAGGVDVTNVYCDMTTDGGGWTKILQYHNASYTPSAGSVGDITTADTPAFAKISDAAINALGTSIGAGRVYRIKGPTSPTGKKAYVKSTKTFNDTAVAFGLFAGGGSYSVCENASYAACSFTNVAATYIDTLAWGLVGNDAERYFADYSGGSVNCFIPSAAGVRCFSAGNSVGHALIPDISIWLK